MSRGYGIQCTNCNTQSATNFSHEIAEGIIKLQNELVAIASSPIYGGWLDVKIWNDYDEPFMMDFLRSHKDHALVVIDEYGNTESALDSEVMTTTRTFIDKNEGLLKRLED